MNTKQKYTKGSVTSKDGTTIGYRQMGSGPGIIIMHGGISSSQYYMKFGAALSDEFTVYIPDRRGRGLSGPFGDNYSLSREVEDLEALLKKTGAKYIFGASSGGLISLKTSITYPNIHKIAAYEPVVYADKSEMDKFNASVQHFDMELSEGKKVTAMVDIAKSEEHPTGAFYKLPDFIMKIFFKLILLQDERSVKGDDVTIEDLMPTLKFDVQLVNETEGKLDNFKNVQSEVLLMGGSKSPLLLKNSLKTLNNLLPFVKRVELQGLDHDSAQDYGKPEIIVQEIKNFYKED
jgi:pimeloyl-ACP methyl ester carboxylesterase